MVGGLGVSKLNLTRYARFHYFKILRLKDTPYKIAKGVALGVFLDFLPLPFISLIIAYIIAKIAKFNTIAAVTTAAVLKPAVFLIFWPLNILVGKFILGKQTLIDKMTYAPEPDNILKIKDYILHLIDYIGHLGTPFLLGSIINAVVWGAIVYFIVSRILYFRQLKRIKRIEENSNEIVE